MFLHSTNTQRLRQVSSAAGSVGVRVCGTCAICVCVFVFVFADV